MSIFGRVCTLTDHPTNKLGEWVLFFILRKEIRLNAWFILTSLLPTMK